MSTGEEEEGDIERLLRLAGARPAAPADVEARVHAAVLERWRDGVTARHRRRRVSWTAGLAALAAALVVVVLPAVRRPGPPAGRAGAAGGVAAGATLTRVVGSPRIEPALSEAVAAGAAIPDDTEIVTGPGDRAALRLSDDTVLRLDRETRLRLRRGPRIELEQGAVYAESPGPARAGRAFRIDTGLGTVRDVGTRFQVRLTGDVLKVTVRSGIARMERDGVTRDAGTGTQLVADALGAIAVTSAPVYGPEWDWTLSVAPEFELEGHTLGEFLDWAAAEHGLRVEFEDPAVRPRAVATVLHGSVRGMDPDEALDTVLPTCGLRHSLRDDVLLIARTEAVSR
jgi:ferric-dicitrate binding protein FerR (iron transport regulator)